MANAVDKLPPKAPGRPPVSNVPPKPAKAQPPKPVAPKAAPKQPLKPEAPKTSPTQPPKPETPKTSPTQPPKKEAPKAAPKQPSKKETPKAALKQPPKQTDGPKQAPVKPAAQTENVENQAKPGENLAAEKPAKPQKPSDEAAGKELPEKPEKADKDAAVDDKNLKVVEKALSVEELNQRKQRRIRNATYAMAAVVLLLIIALIIIIFWPTEQKVEARYDLNFDSIPAVTKIEHSIYSEDVTGNIVTFKKSITIENPLNSSYPGYTSFIMSVKFTDALGNDVSDKAYIRLDENNAEDIYNLSNIRAATIGELEGIPNHQIYVNLGQEKYIYFTNVLAKGDEPYSLLLGFLSKDQELLKSEIKMTVTIYGFNADNLTLSTTAEGTHIRAANGELIPAQQEWVDAVKNSLLERS